ncbi:MAG: plasmid recombination protein [Eubacteriales bacterium]|nr:plasmid recombination protein [Eubacteriales bacterium]
MGKNYSIFRVSKLKTASEFAKSYAHNLRTKDVRNADPALRDKNGEVVDLYGRTYQDVYEDTLREMKAYGAYGPNKKVRSNAVRGLEVVLRYTREADGTFNHDEWVQENLKWLNETFNPKEGVYRIVDDEGNMTTIQADNIKSVVVHNDEGTPHIHAFVVPIDEHGRLNAAAYIGSPQRLAHLQTDYGNRMKMFGLERGEYYSTATAEQVRRYYTNLENAVDATLPSPEKDESIEDYAKRANESYQVALTHARDDHVKMEQKIIQARSEGEVRARKLEEELQGVNDAFNEMASILGSDRIGSEESKVILDLLKKERDLSNAMALSQDQDLVDQYRNSENLLLMQERNRQKERKMSRSDILMRE